MIRNKAERIRCPDLTGSVSAPGLLFLKVIKDFVMRATINFGGEDSTIKFPPQFPFSKGEVIIFMFGGEYPLYP